MPVAVVRDKDGAPGAVGSVRAGQALPFVVPGVEAVGLLLTFTTDVVVILLPRLATPAQTGVCEPHASVRRVTLLISD